MSLKEVQVPDIGSHGDVPVIEILVAPGDTVTRDQGLVTLESDKATMEVPSTAAGVVREVKVKLGDSVSEGTVVAIIETTDEAAAAKAEAPAPVAAKEAARAPEVPKAETKAAPIAASSAAAATTAAPGPRTPPIAFDADAVLPSKVPYASPAVRLFARQLGVDLDKVTGTGREARILREDVQAFVKTTLAGGVVAGRAPGGGGAGLSLLPWPQVDFAKFGEVESLPLSRIKKISGANLARNWAMIPHVTQFDAADITEMEDFRKKLGEENKELKITPLVFQIKAVVAALQAYPSFNASLDGDNLVLKKYFHIGIAVDTPDGLMVPVLRDCDQKGLLQLARELGEISKKARDKKLGPADMSGGCFSISSLGGIGGTSFTPIINAPEVAILGVSRASLQPVWNGEKFKPRLMLPLSLSYDHRVIDGAEAARFTRFLAQQLGDIRRLLL